MYQIGLECSKCVRWPTGRSQATKEEGGQKMQGRVRERREETIIISRGFSTRVSRVCLFTIQKAERNPPPTFLFFFENHWINVHCVFALFSTQPSTAAEAKCHTFSIWSSSYQTRWSWFQSKDRVC